MPPPAVDAVLTQMDRLDRVITRRLQIEDAFIQAMVEEFQAIRNDLAECEQNLNAARNAARNPLSGSVPVNIDPVNIDLREIGQRLDTAINTLQTAAPLNANNLDNMIDTVVGTNTDGSSRRSRPRPFLQSDGTPPGGQYLYLNPAAAAAQRPAAQSSNAAPAPAAAPALAAAQPAASWWNRAANAFRSQPQNPYINQTVANTRRLRPTRPLAPAPTAASINLAEVPSNIRITDAVDESGRKGVVGQLGPPPSAPQKDNLGGWRTRRRRSKRHSKKRKP